MKFLLILMWFLLFAYVLFPQYVKQFWVTNIWELKEDYGLVFHIIGIYLKLAQDMWTFENGLWNTIQGNSLMHAWNCHDGYQLGPTSEFLCL